MPAAATTTPATGAAAREVPATMRAVEAAAFGLDALRLVERPVPRPGPGEVLLRVRAASLNYRDLVILKGVYRPDLPLPYVPASDGCGEVVAVGEGVTRFRVGDRAVPTYTQGWIDGLPTPEMRSQRTLGAPLAGLLQDYVVVPAEDAVAAPSHLTDAEAATLPIAALTAWSVLQEGSVKPGDWVLVEGTGGVAVFALQLAKLAGARVVALSSSDEKLARARELGADATINYRTTPEWAGPVREATGGRGVDIVVETGGAATLPQALAAVAFGGFVGVVGFVGGFEATVDVRRLLGPIVRVQGIAVGSRSRFEAMNRAIAAHGLRPVVDSTFPLEAAAEAFALMERGGHFGKIAVSLA
jgi:NADPH:quinone reductase-like Zn-dependent oxidoreductase